MKKKMKKSKSIKRSGFESLESPILNTEVPQSGKPPPTLNVSANKATPQKQSDSSPNYMKSTSCFEARKERSQVSSRRIQSSFDSKSPKKIANSSKLGSNSSHKPIKTLTRTSSLKLVRTLTKFPSFKPARNLCKCSQVVLCENLKVQRATCSSTLKDSKFPNYLDLSSGATESEGTSVMKVCPYTYCSLNGHGHAASPPLKCFLSARRRMMKTQKSMKLGCLSPRRAKPSGDGIKEIIDKIALDEKPRIQEMGSENHEMDFFVEIYVGDTGENGDDWDEIDSSVGFEDNLDKKSEVIATEMEVAEEAYAHSFKQEKETSSTFDELEEQIWKLDGTDSETSDMDWEEGQYSALSWDYIVGNPTKTANDLESGTSYGDDNPGVPEETIFKCDNFDERSADEGLEEFFSSDSEGLCQNLGTDDSMLVLDKKNHPVSPVCDELEESTTEEQDGNAELDDFVAAKTEDPKTNESPKQEIPIVDAGNGRDDEGQENAATSRTRIPSFDTLEDDNNKLQLVAMAEDVESNKVFVDEDLDENQSQANNVFEDQKQSEKDKGHSFKIWDSLDFEENTHSGLNKVSLPEDANEDNNQMEVECSTMLEPDQESLIPSGNLSISRVKTAFKRGGKRPVEELANDPISLRIIRCKRSDEDLEEARKFNPQEPNFLPVEPDPEAEKVDLRHQMMDERRNSEEWMIDYALQQAVTKLAPARKKKVALLVEAFENVMPMPKYESRLRHTRAAGFAHVRPMQACS